MDPLTLVIVGLVAGLLASAVLRGSSFGLLGDILIGIAGSFVGSWGFRELGWKSPIAGLGGVILVAFLGALAILLVVRLLPLRRR